MLVEPALHGFENVLMFPSANPSFLAGGAGGLDCTALAGVGLVATQDQSVFLGRVAVGELLTGRTNVNILGSHIAEILLAEASFRGEVWRALDISFASGVSVMSSFQANGITPEVVLTATHAAVIKAYVAAGFPSAWLRTTVTRF
jgi:hypothetical protein